MVKKGQAAMEFLMTYGWAILVVLAAIGALAYFGVLSPDRFLPDKCTANPPFACTEYKINTTSVYFSLQNSAGVDVTVSQVLLSCDGGTNTANATTGGAAIIQNGNANPLVWDAGDLPTGCAALTDGNKFKATYDITYIKAGETIDHTGSGSVQVRVEG
jgi:hypothetical protein